MNKPNVKFTIHPTKHKDFPKRLEKELYVLNLLRIDAWVHEDSSVMIPHMDWNGYTVAGTNDIQAAVHQGLVWYLNELEESK